MTMWLKLDLEDIDFRFRISKYQKSIDIGYLDKWCKVDLTLKAQEWLNYNMVYREALLPHEVEYLCDKIEALLNDKLNEPEIITCIEPDLEFHLFPKDDIRNNPDVVYVRPGSNTIVDVTMDLIVSFWDKDGVLTANQLKLAFNREDIEKLHCYLKYIIGTITEEDKIFPKLIADGIIYEDEEKKERNKKHVYNIEFRNSF